MAAKQTAKKARKPQSPDHPKGDSVEAGAAKSYSGSGPDRLGAGDGTTSQSKGESNFLHNIAGTTSRVVQQAASILEEEIAAGIVAAKRVEERLINVQKLRGGGNEEVMQRFRGDAHQVVDIVIDLVNLATNSLGELAQRAIKISGGKSGAEKRARTKGGATGIPSLIVEKPVKPGSVAQVPLTLENESDSATESFQFVSSDLVNMTGDRIPAGKVEFMPVSLTIAPRTSETVTVSVHVPASTKAGVYSGLLQATKLGEVRAILIVSIAR